jgi:hypothetical protein
MTPNNTTSNTCSRFVPAPKAGAAVQHAGLNAPSPAPHVKTKRIVVDSRDRNVATHARPDRYDIKFPDDIENVVALRLVVADVPFSAPDVDARNDALLVDGLPVHIEHGDFADSADLADAVSNAVRAVRADVSVSYNARRDAFDFSSPAPFAVAFGTAPGSTAARMLGYAEGGEYTSPAC